MPYQYFTYRNNAITTLASGLSDIGVILIVKNGTGGLFPSEYPYLLVLENIVNDVVMKREIVKVIRRDGDTFKIERSAGYCMASDTATTKTNTAFEFSTDDRASLRFIEEELADMHAELIRLDTIELLDASDTQKGTPKLTTTPISPTDPIAVSELDTRLPSQAENDAMAGTYGTPGTGNEYVTATDPLILDNMKLTGNETVGGIKTFSSIPELPASTIPTDPNHAVSMDGLKWIDAGNVSETGDMGSSTNAGAYSDSRGFRFYANKAIIIKSLYIYSAGSPYISRVILKNDAGAILENTTITPSAGGQTITLSWNTIIPAGTYFRIETDANGSGLTFRRWTPGYPDNRTNINFVSGSIAGVDDATYRWSIETITTASIT